MMSISAVIPVYNAEKYIEEAVNSLFNQSLSTFIDEVIIIDDCSNDSSPEIIINLAKIYKKIKPIFLEKNSGVSRARNLGLQLARSEWILFLDADDLLDSSLLEEYNNFLNALSLQEYNDTILIYSACQQIDEKGRMIGNILRGHSLKRKNGFGDLIVRNYIVSPSGTLVRREAIIRNNGFDESMHCNEDVDLWLRLSLEGDFWYIDKPLTFIRRHDSNATVNMEKAHSAEKMLFKKYDLDFIEKMIYSRPNPRIKNIIDFVSILFRVDEWEKGAEILFCLKEPPTEFKISYLFLVSIYYLKRKDYVKAKKEYEKIIKLNSMHGAALNNLAVLFLLEEQKEKGIELLNRALSAYPNYMDAKHNLNEALSSYDEKEYKFTWRELRKSLMTYGS